MFQFSIVFRCSFVLKSYFFYVVCDKKRAKIIVGISFIGNSFSWERNSERGKKREERERGKENKVYLTKDVWSSATGWLTTSSGWSAGHWSNRRCWWWNRAVDDAWGRWRAARSISGTIGVVINLTGDGIAIHNYFRFGYKRKKEEKID